MKDIARHLTKGVPMYRPKVKLDQNVKHLLQSTIGSRWCMISSNLIMSPRWLASVQAMIMQAISVMVYAVATLSEVVIAIAFVTLQQG